MSYLKLGIFFLLSIIFNTKLCSGQTSLTVSNVKVTFSKKTDYTDFTVQSSLNGNFNNVWLAVGFNNKRDMVNWAFFFIK